MVPKLNEAKATNLSLRRCVRRFWIEEKSLVRIGRSVVFHTAIALPLEALLIWLGCPALCAFVVAVTIAVAIEIASLKSEAEDKNS
jgi:hypothetical protein